MLINCSISSGGAGSWGERFSDILPAWRAPPSPLLLGHTHVLHWMRPLLETPALPLFVHTVPASENGRVLEARHTLGLGPTRGLARQVAPASSTQYVSNKINYSTSAHDPFARRRKSKSAGHLTQKATRCSHFKETLVTRQWSLTSH